MQFSVLVDSGPDGAGSEHGGEEEERGRRATLGILGMGVQGRRQIGVVMGGLHGGSVDESVKAV